jgi:hypothetical protein
MAARKSPAGRVLQVEIPEGVGRRLDELLVQTRRSVDAEVTLALEFWLERQGAGEAAVEQAPSAAMPTVPPAKKLQEQAKETSRQFGRRPNNS